MSGTTPPRKRLYLGVCCLQRPFDDQSQARIRAESAAVNRITTHLAAGGADLITSDVLEDESGLNPHADRRHYIELILALAVETVHRTDEIAAHAAELEAAGLKSADALHVASAAAGGADYFCTCDDRLRRRGRAAQTPPPMVVTPLELVKELGL